MVAIRQLDRAAWEARARQLAVARHLDGTARGPYADAATGERCYYVPSQSSQTAHLVIETPRGVRCDCTAGARFGQPCGHAGSAMLAIEQRERAMATRTPAQVAREEYWQAQWDALGAHGAIKRVREEW